MNTYIRFVPVPRRIPQRQPFSLSSIEISPSTDRIRGPQGINLRSLECSVCRNLLWKPCACSECETPFCKSCLDQWSHFDADRCPMRCENYSIRPCPKFILEELSRLQIACIYGPKHCSEVVSYESLPAHELQCGQQLVKCSGCQTEVAKKDFAKHESQCDRLEMTCPDCQFVHRNEFPQIHTEKICLKRQNQQLRQDLEKLQQQIKQMRISNNLLLYQIINFADLPRIKREIGVVSSVYKGLQWIGCKYMHMSHALKSLPQSGFAKVFSSIGNSYIMYSDGAATITVADPNEIFSIAWLAACGVWNDNLHLTMKGYRKGEQIYTHTTVLLFGETQQIHLCWTEIDMIKLKAFGGTPRRGTTITNSSTFAMTALFIDIPQ